MSKVAVTYEIILTTAHNSKPSPELVGAVISALTDTARALQMRFELLDIAPEVLVTHRVNGGKPNIISIKKEPTNGQDQ